MTSEEMVVLVDAQDLPCGVAPKLLAHQKGWLHRAFSIFVFRETDGALLMQKRHIGKYHSPGLWSNTCCGHPRPGETIEQAASRRLGEELGLQLTLQPVGSFQYRADCGPGMVEHEWDHVLVGWIKPEDFERDQRCHPEEIEAVQWVLPAVLGTQIAAQPERYTPWLASAWTCCLSGMRPPC